jgi:dolichol-phosphate mannosyltransferase
LAVIIPVYNEGAVIQENFRRIRQVLAGDGLSCHFVLVDDGSSDGTWQEISLLANEFPEVSLLRFARNFGKEAAICAGLERVEARRYLIMDSDLQHPPRCVKEMLALMEREQADIVDGIKDKRGKESPCYRLLANSFYRLLKLLTGLELERSSDFKLLDRRVVDALRRFEESSLFFRGLVAWVGFKKVAYSFAVDGPGCRRSRFSTGKLIRLALSAILSYTSKPLYLTIISGLLFLLISAALGIQTLFNYFSGRAVSGFTTVILLLLFTGSMIMISLGFIGVYISRIYDEVKRRPRYIVSETAGE